MGIVLSVIWFLGFATWGWNDSLEEIRQSYKFAVSACRNESLRLSEPASSAQYKRCQDQESAIFEDELEKNRRHLPILLVTDLVTIIFAWTVMWLIVDSVRWARKRGIM